MRVHILGVRGLPSSYSGYETIVGELAPRLAAQGHDVTVYCRRSLFPVRVDSWKGVRLRYMPSLEHKAFSTLSHSFLCVSAAIAARADVILMMNAATGWVSWVPWLFRRPCVINVDGMEWLRPKWNRLGKWMFHTGARLACRFGSVVVTDAEEMHRLYAKEFGIDSIYIAYGGVLAESKNPDVVRQYGLEPGKYFLVASRLVPDNNADLIVQAFTRCAGDLQLAIAGGADYRGNRTEREFADKLKRLADGRVKFLGHVDNPDHVQELHCNCFGYIHGHQFGGINPSLLKALGCGNMVLALNTPFNAEVLEEGRYGLLFEKTVDDLADKIRRCLADDQMVKGFRDGARARIQERFTWDRIAGEYIKLLESIVRGAEGKRI